MTSVITTPNKKQPEIVRSNLLLQALRIIQTDGVHGLTLDAVARQAGVSKGGLLHHFPSKQALIDAMIEQVFHLIDKRIEEELANDTVANGRFTRAYLSLLRHQDDNTHNDAHHRAEDELDFLYSIPLTTLMFDDEGCRAQWHNWLARQLVRHAATDSFDNARLVRFTADGIWLSGLLQYDPIGRQEYEALVGKLRAMTY